jgi:hypothetical protein
MVQDALADLKTLDKRRHADLSRRVREHLARCVPSSHGRRVSRAQPD